MVKNDYSYVPKDNIFVKGEEKTPQPTSGPFGFPLTEPPSPLAPASSSLTPEEEDDLPYDFNEVMLSLGEEPVSKPRSRCGTIVGVVSLLLLLIAVILLFVYFFLHPHRVRFHKVLKIR
mmetsp:Transcript_32257/g.50466  ORF Transcript_32257/g.50466 Transcript_32257/m.50466 type:complete len:119 (-) Transcript_32257:110-466(-)